MKKILLIFSFILIFSFSSFADYPSLKKISKNSTFMDGDGKPYLIENITNKENILLIIWNHGSEPDHKKDSCKLKPKWGYEWDGAVIPAFLRLYDKKINNLTIKIYRLCSGVKGMDVKDQKKIRHWDTINRPNSK